MSRTSNEWAGQSVAQGRYLVRTQLGEGGMGFVYRALDRNLDCDVVIKVPRRAMLDDPEFASRFAREVRSLVRLSHPNIVKVTDVGEHDGMPFAVMQYLSGGSLEDYAVAERNAASFTTSLTALNDWLPGVAAALDFVHAQGYVHRDVKPGNILFDAHGHVFLSDFGVAKALAAAPETPSKRGQTAVTGAGMILGTPEYMAPELIMGEPFDGRIDQYALAVTVYEMLAGRRPFEAASPTACMVMQTTKAPPLLSAVEPRVPHALAEVVARALSKEPAQRYATCAAFAAAVVSVASGAAGTSKTPSGHAVRPDQVRLRCPSCEKTLVLPAAVLADPQKSRGKRLNCPSCQALLRVSEDGRSLVPGAAVSSSSSAMVPSPSPSPALGTRKVVAPRAEAIPTARPPGTPTLRQTPSPPPVRPETPASTTTRATARTTIPNWALGAGVLGIAVAAAVFVAVVIVPAWTGPKAGHVLVDTTAVPPGAVFALDGHAVDAAVFGNFLSLRAGVHDLAVSKDGFEPYTLRFPVSAGEESGFKVVLSRLTPPPAVQPPAQASVERAPEVSTRREPTPSASVQNLLTRVLPPRSVAPPVDRPATPAPVTFEPIPDGPPIDKASLSALLKDPASFASRVVVPTGLFVLGPVSMEGQDGLARATVTQVVLQVRGNNLAHVETVEAPAEVQISPTLVNSLRQLAGGRSSVSSGTVDGPWGQTSSVLTFEVQQRSGGSESGGWVPILKKIEFLVAMNFPHIGEGNFKDSFKTITVTSNNPPRQGFSDRHDWKARLGVPYANHIKRYVHNIKDAKFFRDMQVINNAMAPTVNSLIRNNTTPADIMDARTRRGR